MAVFVELVTDLFSTVFGKISEDQAGTRRAGASSARRPLRGLEIKDDTYAYLRVVDVAGNPLDMFDSGGTGGYSKQYSNFILQSVQEARMEKQQIVETFGDSYIFFFGEQPRFLDVQVILLNSNDFNWEAEFWANYDAYWRGSKLTELGARLYLFYDDNVVEGYMLQAQAVKSSTEPLMVTLTFRLFLTNYQNVSFITDDFPVRATASLPPGLSLEDGTAYSALLDASDQASQLRGVTEEAAQLAIQQQAFAQFGGGARLASALAGGLPAGMGPQLTGGSLGTIAGGVSGGAAGNALLAASQAYGGLYASGGPQVYSTLNYLSGSAFPNNLPINQGFASRPPFPTDSIYGPGYNGIYSDAQPRIAGLPPAGLTGRTTPLRSKISDNLDEWVGGNTQGDNAQFEEPPEVTDVPDLHRSSVLMLGAYGVHADGFASLGALGMAPRFSPAGVGLGAGAGFSAGASFGFSASAGVGANAGVVPGIPGGVGYGSSVGIGTTVGALGPYASLPLTNANGFTTPPPSPINPYGNYPGYGQGYGSALPGVNGGYSAGPSLRSGASAYVSIGSSYGGGSGMGAVTQVGGQPTCFALESYPGTLNIQGTAYQSPDGVFSVSAFSVTRTGVL